MPRGDLLGSLEYIVLLALVRPRPDAYGMTVRREIEMRVGRNLSIGAVYATLERLEAKGYVARRSVHRLRSEAAAPNAISESTPRVNGRSKRRRTPFAG